MKTTLTIFFSLLLVSAQAWIALGAPRPSSAVPCPRCACHQVSCCPTPDAPPLPLSATPSRTLSDSQNLLLQPVIMALIPLFTPPIPVSPLARLLRPRAAAAPLYAQNCSYLI